MSLSILWVRRVFLLMKGLNLHSRLGNPVSSENVQWQRWSTWNNVTISQSETPDCEMSFNSGLRHKHGALGRPRRHLPSVRRIQVKLQEFH
ncbi:unnamed protein product [Pleuronectes platessa]|uniref:Secreted protein n=1 Tax=Pleuronectes platessa TaxID=8262 RepID=A0A9N7YFX9_PLEPL|nr:unnamed protein product [Pleuronectes platessa]